MKKTWVVALCLILSCCAYGIAKDYDDTPTVEANSTVEQELAPNYAEISISVENNSKDVKEVAEQNAEISTKVVTALKDLLDPKKGDSIETLNYNLTPQYTYKDGKSTLSGYEASNTVRVKLRDTKSVSAVIDAAISSGATNVSSLKFGYDEESNICNELYAKATKNAYSQAQSVAKALGSQVTGARNITTSCSLNNNNDFRYGRMYMTTSDAKANASTPIEAGTIKVKASIHGVFNIK